MDSFAYLSFFITTLFVSDNSHCNYTWLRFAMSFELTLCTWLKIISSWCFVIFPQKREKKY